MPKQIRTLKDKQTIILQRMQIAAPLWRQNYSEREIRVEVMKRLGLATLSLKTVHDDIRRLLKEWQNERLEDTEERVTAELARLDLVIREAWQQWELKGDPRYLDIILKALEQRRRLLGLDRVQVDLTGTLGGAIEIKHTATGFCPATSEDEVRARDGIAEE